ncbi:hypothetical protein FKM82_003919, partial [Ascaphus truei]
ASCLAVNPVRSADSLYLGKGDAQNILRMEFQLSDLRSNLSSFDFRTFDPEGVIFYGDIGEDNWFVLGVRQRRLEVQMSNGHGQMVLSKWGPDVSDGTWRKVSVDSSVNTIEVTVDGELVVKLTHHVSTQLGAQTYATLNIILGDLPAGSRVHLFRPVKVALDFPANCNHPAGSYFSGCLRITLQGISVDLDAAVYKHHHVRSHSCPQGI